MNKYREEECAKQACDTTYRPRLRDKLNQSIESNSFQIKQLQDRNIQLISALKVLEKNKDLETLVDLIRQ